MRRIDLPDYGPVILSDTVGFIRDLPHGLVSSFHATLEEVANASLLLHVIDASSEDADQRIEDVESVLEEIGANDIPRLEVYNKIDLLDIIAKQSTDAAGGVRKIWLSSRTGEGVDMLMNALGDFFRRGYVLARIRLPAYAGKLRASVYTKIGVMHEQVLDCGDTVLDLEVCESDVNWLTTNQEFREEYWQIKPEMVDTLR